MNPAYLHLLLNHAPVMGAYFGLGILLFGLIFKGDMVMRTGLGVLVASALVAIPVYLTGEPAEERIQKMPGVEGRMIGEHEESAEWTLIGVEALGALALGGLIYFRKKTELPRAFTLGMIVLAFIVSAMMARTAHLGGLIRHPEIGSGAGPPPAAQEDND